MRFVLLSVVLTLCAPAADRVRGPLVVSDRWPQSTDLGSWTRDVMRLEGLEQATETAQGKAFFRWLRLFSRMATGGMIQAYEGEPGAEKYVTDAHKTLFVYGWGYCDTSSRIAEAAWSEFKRDRALAQRVVVQHANGGYHTMYRLRLDGRWGAFDPRYGYYLVERDAPDAQVLDWPQVGDDARILANRTYRHRSAPFFEFFGLEWERALLIEPAYHESEDAWTRAGKPIEHVFGNGQYKLGTKYHDMDFELVPGTVVTRFWDNTARKFYVPKGKHTQREEPFLASGRFYRVTETMLNGNWPKHDPNHRWAKPYLATVPANEGYNRDVAGGRTIGQAWGKYEIRTRIPDSGVFDFASPFVLVDGTLRMGQFEHRTMRAKPSRADEPDHWSEWKPAARGELAVHGSYRFQLRGKPGAAVDLHLHFENGLMTLPQIFAGRNRVRVELRNSPQLPVKITYRWDSEGGERTHQKQLKPSDFRDGKAAYEIDAPGLVRCRSVQVRYGAD
ncbi:MAG: hypothetical protein JNL98_06720 [Bryobacterales bacterium]|nr:hypothetical protein [Bryobacterales bacterium]